MMKMRYYALKERVDRFLVDEVLGLWFVRCLDEKAKK